MARLIGPDMLGQVAITRARSGSDTIAAPRVERVVEVLCFLAFPESGHRSTEPKVIGSTPIGCTTKPLVFQGFFI